MISKEKCLEIAKDLWPEEYRYDIDDQYVTFKIEELSLFANRAYAEGAKDMRERAAIVCEQQDVLLADEFIEDADYDTGLYRGADLCAAAIRSMEA